MQYNLVFSTDVHYLPYLFVLCQSIVDNIDEKTTNSQDELVFNVLIDESVDLDSTKTKANHFIERNSSCMINFRFEWIFVDINLFNKFNSMYREGKQSFSTYYRLIIDKVLPDNINYVAYLDVDTMVLTDIRRLFDENDLKDSILGAVVDSSVLNTKWKDIEPASFIQIYDDQKQKIELPKEHYFNAGILLINMAEWRKQNIGGKCIDLASKLDIQYHDQDLLNYVCKDQVKLLDISWNLQSHWFYVVYNQDSQKYDIECALDTNHKLYCETPAASAFEQALTNPCIVHFTCSKPWWSILHCTMTKYEPLPLTPLLHKYVIQWQETSQHIKEFSIRKNITQDAVSITDINNQKNHEYAKNLHHRLKKSRKLYNLSLIILLLLNFISLILHFI